jgi:hypothetical protein
MYENEFNNQTFYFEQTSFNFEISPGAGDSRAGLLWERFAGSCASRDTHLERASIDGGGI